MIKIIYKTYSPIPISWELIYNIVIYIMQPEDKYYKYGTLIDKDLFKN